MAESLRLEALRLLDGPNWAVERATLIPECELPAVLDELRAALAPCGQDVARGIARRIAACYPNFRAQDGWSDAAAGLLATAPADIARAAAAEVVRTVRFPPSVAEIAAAVDPPLRRRRMLLHRAGLMPAEHERRRAEAARAAEVARGRAERAARIEDLVARLGAARRTGGGSDGD